MLEGRSCKNALFILDRNINHNFLQRIVEQNYESIFVFASGLHAFIYSNENLLKSFMLIESHCNYTYIFYMFRVDKFGMQVLKEDCVYHWGRIYKKRGDRGSW